MLDVHPPHEPAHTWKDFFLHIATLVIGLLIAVGLEQTVEFFHQRSEVRETRERIRAELEDNRRIIHVNEARLRQDAARWQTYGAQLSNAGIDAGQIANIDFTWDLQIETNAAWENTRQSAVFSYMPPDENLEYAYLYRLFAENYATSVLYIADVRTGDAIVQRVRANHVLDSGDRERLLAIIDSLNGRARNQLDLYAYLDQSLSDWLDDHRASH